THDTTDASSFSEKYQCVRSEAPETSPSTATGVGTAVSSARPMSDASAETAIGRWASPPGDAAVGLAPPAALDGSNFDRPTAHLPLVRTARAHLRRGTSRSAAGHRAAPLRVASRHC